MAADKADALKALANEYQAILKNELAAKEKNLTVLLESVANEQPALTAQSRDTFVRLLNATPNGVIRNSDVAKGVVETSLNVGVVTMTSDNVQIHCLIRSLIDSGKDYVVSMLDSLGKLAGAKTEAKGAYPGWQPDANSPVMHLVRETYQRLFNKTRLSTRAWSAVCSKNRIRIWTWFLSGQPSPVLTPRMSRFISKAWASTGRC